MRNTSAAQSDTQPPGGDEKHGKATSPVQEEGSEASQDDKARCSKVPISSVGQAEGSVGGGDVETEDVDSDPLRILRRILRRAKDEDVGNVGSSSREGGILGVRGVEQVRETTPICRDESE